MKEHFTGNILADHSVYIVNIIIHVYTIKQ